ncbi:MAG: hypothetical protein WCF23_03030 [Candidatus Nitrosopolaris sp.]
MKQILPLSGAEDTTLSLLVIVFTMLRVHFVRSEGQACPATINF